MDFRLSEEQTACIKKLAERFEKNEAWVSVPARADKSGNFVDPIELPLEKREAILSVMEHMGLIVDVTPNRRSEVGSLHSFSFGLLGKSTRVNSEPQITEKLKAIRDKKERFSKSGKVAGYGGILATVPSVNRQLAGSGRGAVGPRSDSAAPR
jgi:hypothetical protein